MHLSGISFRGMNNIIRCADKTQAQKLAAALSSAKKSAKPVDFTIRGNGRDVVITSKPNQENSKFISRCLQDAAPDVPNAARERVLDTYKFFAAQAKPPKNIYTDTQNIQTRIKRIT